MTDRSPDAGWDASRSAAGAHNPWLVTLILSIATFMRVLDTSIANVALINIAGALGTSVDESTWVLTSYLVANAVVLPISGRLSEVIGRKRFYMISVEVFFACLVLVRGRAEPAPSHRGPRSAGGRRRHGAERAGDARGLVSPFEAGAGLRRLRRRGDRRAGARPDDRRLPDRQRLVALDLLHQSLSGARDLDATVAAAASADSRASAYFIRRRIELTAAWRKHHGAILGFANAGDPRFPVARTASGLVSVYPIDALAWTPETARALEAMSAAGPGPKILLITGTATPLAKSHLAAVNFRLEERAKL